VSDLEELPVAGTVVLLKPLPHGFQVLLVRRPDRGSFAGAWVFPGGKVEDDDRERGSSELDDARRAGIRETFEEVGLTVQDLVVLSRWQPPTDVAPRIRTWFFLATAPNSDLTLSDGEVVEAVWVSPTEALERHAAGEWILFPPTWMTLHQLSRHESAEAALEADAEPQVFATRMVKTPEGVNFEWDGLRLHTGSLPWRLSEESTVEQSS
jgi:8-oxo-dGTP pyrophosphatase MutT (NUDIX family)